ncbi:MAG TPA: MBL fold metallo-hydrolase [Acidimicrobiia bacterium]|nr:MBL fold metallo-hydrolase [Acidimicrobiia bacterium]
MFDELGDGVFRRRYESLDLNVGIVIGDDGVLVIDTRSSPREAAQIKDELARITDLPVRWVVNTHWHFDHTFGNYTFRQAEIWGHELCQIALSQRTAEMKESARRWLGPEHSEEIETAEIVPPHKIFTDQASLDIGRRVEMGYFGFGHTDSDIVVSVPDSSVAFFGDLVEEGAPPVFGDGYPVTWPLTLRLAAQDPPGTIVPGHGHVVDPAFVHSQHEELVAVAELSTRFVDGEIELEGATASGPYSEEVMRSALLRAQAVA